MSKSVTMDYHQHEEMISKLEIFEKMFAEAPKIIFLYNRGANYEHELPNKIGRAHV